MDQAQEDTAREALQRAIGTVGSATKVAELFGITVQAVGQWQVCPWSRVLALEEATGGQVKRHELRPDVYPPPETVKEAS